MSNEVSSGAAKIYIKLSNGNGIDLNALNNLVDKECNDSIFLNWEAKNGNGNSIFNQDEVNLLKEQLYRKYLDDQQLSQDDLDEIFGKNSNGESNVNNSALHKSFMKLSGEKPSIELEDNQEPEKEKEIENPADKKPIETPLETETESDKKTTNYIIQNGDTPQKIVERLKLQGDEAKKVLEELKQALGNRKYFSIGEVVKLSGDYSQKIAEMSDYKTDFDEIEKDYKKDKARKEALNRTQKDKQQQTIPSNVQNYINRLKSKNIDHKLNQNGDGTFTIIQKSGFNNPNVTETVRTYDKTGVLTSHTQSYKSGDVRTFQYDKTGKESIQTLIKNNGEVFIGLPNAQGKITSMKKIFKFKDNKSSVSVIKHNDGSFEIIEKRADFASEGILSKTHRFDKTGKHVKTIKYVKPEQKAKTEPMKPFWANANQEKWQPNPTTAGSNTTASETNKSQPKTQAKNVEQKKSQPKVQQQKSFSQASLIPGLENIGLNPLAPKTERDLIRFINADELQYPEKMRMCIAELRAAGIECKIQYQDNNENYVAVIDDKNCTLLDYNENRFGKTVIVFDKSGNLIQSRRNEFGIGQDTVTTYSDGKAKSRSMQKSEQLKQVNGKTGIPYAVEREFEKIKLNSQSAEVVKNADNTFSLVCVPSDETNKFNSSKIEYVYNWDGKQLYQLHFSSSDESVKIGRLNPKTKEIEFKDFKDADGIIINIPDNVMQKYNEMQQGGGKVTIEKGKDEITITQTKSQYMDANNIAKIVHKYDAFGKLLTQDYTMKNGRVLNYYDASKKGEDGAHIPNPMIIDFSHAPQYQGEDTDSDQMIYGLDTKGPKDTAQRFAKTLSSEKTNLMGSLRLTNEEYDNLAILAMGIAEQETHFGQKEYVDTKKGTHSQSGVGTRANTKYYYNKFSSDESQDEHSQGITQIRFSNAIKDPIIKKRLADNGIKTFDDIKSSVEKQATATMIIISSYKTIAESAIWQARLRKNNALVEKKYPNGMKDSSGEHYSKDDLKLTTNDIIAMLWNGAGGIVERMNSGEVITILTNNKKVKTGKKQVGVHPETGEPIYSDVSNLKGCSYARNVRAYSSKFFATPATDSPGYMHTTKHGNQVGALGAQSQNNSGAIGEVVFMPTTYSNKWRVASQQNKTDLLNLIKDETKTPNLSSSYRNVLAQLVNDNKIGFGRHGLTEDEAKELTDADVKLMVNTLQQVESKKITPQEANERFAKSYLESRQFVVSNSSIPQSSIIKSMRSDNPKRMDYVTGTLDYEVHSSFYAGGSIRQHTASYVSSDDKSYKGFAVTRSQGINPILANGQTSPRRDRVMAEYGEYTATHTFESGGHCKNGISVDIEYCLGIDHKKIRGKGGKSLPHAKMLTEFYDAHPELFEHVQYVDLGNKKSREFNATDIANLPCGYLGVFKPGKGFEHESGHAFVSDGFGGCNADEHDNGKWAQFGNGKGEHGQLEVYRLSSNVATVYSEKLGRTVNVPLNINPWYLTPEFKELQAQERAKRGLPPLEEKEEFQI